MPSLITILIACGIFLALAALHALLGSKKPVQRAAGSVCVGICALAAVNFTGFFTGVSIPVSALSIGVSAGGGIPGVTLMLLLNLLFR